jgi:hypothetical protein
VVTAVKKFCAGMVFESVVILTTLNGITLHKISTKNYFSRLFWLFSFVVARSSSVVASSFLRTLSSSPSISIKFGLARIFSAIVSFVVAKNNASIRNLFYFT